MTVRKKSGRSKAGKSPPIAFKPCEAAPDPITGHWPGWVWISGNDKWHIEAWKAVDKRLPDGKIKRADFDRLRE